MIAPPPISPLFPSPPLFRSAAAVPVAAPRDAVEVFEKPPREAGLADPADPGDGDEGRLALLGGSVEETLHLTKLAVSPDERRLEPLPLERAAVGGDDPARLPERYGLLLALQPARACFLADDP